MLNIIIKYGTKTYTTYNIQWNKQNLDIWKSY